MATLQINVEARDRYKGFTAKQLRRKGFIPAVTYANGQTTKHLVIQEKELVKTFSGKQVHVLELNFGGKNAELAILQDVQRDCLTNRIIHVDFHGVRQDVATQVKVTIQLVGSPIGVKDGGVLDHSLREVTVECLPKDVPDRIVFDMTNVKLDDVVYVKDLAAPANVKFIEKELNQPILSIHMPKQEKEEAPVAAATVEGAAGAPGTAATAAAPGAAAPAAGAKAASPAAAGDKKADKK